MSSNSDSADKERKCKKGKKNPESWKRNKTKYAQTHGKRYLNTRGNVFEPKTITDFNCIVVICVLTTVRGGWLDEISNDRGIDLGNGVTLRIDQLNRKNVSVFERHALQLNYGKFGLRIEKSLNKDALQVGLYIKDNIEGRGKKVDEITIPAIIGFKVTAIAAMIFVTVAVLVLKAFALSKLSAAVTAGILLSKFLTHKSSNKQVEEKIPYFYYPSIYEDPSSTGYNLNNISPYYAYPDYDPKNLHRSEAKGQYSVVETPENDLNSTDASKRVDNQKRQPFFYTLPLKKYKYYS
ncbi:hypothetical protein RN001_011976 [Aquatica leii]|uniref:Uncharacterized protein n=1 Tax=Aquatica leii TaxID=1421715 RepID=A0AAN7PSG1_9COLE|nr:hypothetical protein RN001_011976 [Aquatica leii]